MFTQNGTETQNETSETYRNLLYNEGPKQKPWVLWKRGRLKIKTCT